MSAFPFVDVFKTGELVRSGGPRSVLRIRQVTDSFISVVPVSGIHQMAMRLHYGQLEAVVKGFSRIDPDRIAPTIQPVLVEAGLKKETTTENYLYGFARAFLERVAGKTVQIFPDEISERYTVLEGASEKVLVNRYERDPRARAICLAYWKAACVVCKMDFFKCVRHRGGIHPCSSSQATRRDRSPICLGPDSRSQTGLSKLPRHAALERSRTLTGHTSISDPET
jgi:hypothetical protein